MNVMLTKLQVMQTVADGCYGLSFSWSFFTWFGEVHQTHNNLRKKLDNAVLFYFIFLAYVTTVE